MMSLAGHLPVVSGILGNIHNPAYVPSLNDYPRPYSFINRFKNFLIFTLGPILWRHVYVVPLVQDEVCYILL